MKVWFSSIRIKPFSGIPLLGNIKQTGLKLHKVSAAGLAAVG